MRRWKTVLPVAMGALLGLGGCASVPAGSSTEGDPLQSYNRTMFGINDTLDRHVIKPVAEGYRAVAPDFVRAGVTNFFGNLSDLSTTVNDFLQGKFRQGGADGGRFFLDSTIGIFGFFDVATPVGLERHREDFGQTMAVWGWENSSYFVIPILGPSTVRDSLGLVGEYPWTIYPYLNTTWTKQIEIGSVDVLNTRTNLLAATNLLDTAALDPYAFMRDAYLQRRRNLIYDGHPPPLPEDE
ncbi:VacJ family lipoprotein [Ferrovum sp.]|uniref:MlaA family lipoprotein n=1 Tax=Ferrovum sp. TaxID=2609467 RepID=UPI00260161FF|nr:VacJ family lipoprotein [Ferrovum sp.]